MTDFVANASGSVIDVRDEHAMLRQFITVFEATPDWTVLVHEEAKEVVEAVDHLLKELGDFIYVITGLEVSGQVPPKEMQDNPPEAIKTAVKWLGAMGRILPDDIVREALMRIHASNMSKVGDDGKPIKREDGKIMKGPNYAPPVLTDLVHKAF